MKVIIPVLAAIAGAALARPVSENDRGMTYETSVASKYDEAKKDIYVAETTKDAYDSGYKDDGKSNKNRYYKKEGEKSHEKGKKNEEDCEDGKYEDEKSQDGKGGQKGEKKGQEGGKNNKHGNKEDKKDIKSHKRDNKEDQKNDMKNNDLSKEDEKKEQDVKHDEKEESKPQEDKKDEGKPQEDKKDEGKPQEDKKEDDKPQEDKKEDDKDKQVVTAPAYEWTYGYNAGHPNPDYCKGFKIEHPTLYDLAYESGSTQEIKWSIDQSQLIAGKEANSIFRIRVLSFGNYNQQVIGEDLDVYNKDNTGSVRFPLDLKNDSGMYKYRIMVNYGNETIHCVYESVPFRISQYPGKKFDLTPYWAPYKGAIYSQDADSGMKYHEKRAI